MASILSNYCDANITRPNGHPISRKNQKRVNELLEASKARKALELLEAEKKTKLDSRKVANDTETAHLSGGQPLNTPGV
jgi:hypothetical protein